MGQAATVDGPDGRAAGETKTPSFETVKSLSSRAPVTAHRRLEDRYETTGRVVGNGVCGDVLLAKRRADGRRFALKTMRKKQFEGNDRQHLTSEVEIYLNLDHPNIARLHDVFETQDAIHLLTQFCEGGELYARLRHRGAFPEPEALHASGQMLRAVGYLHSHHIVHRDIKLENFVYETRDAFSDLKLIDFGMATVWDQSTPMVAQCGSLMYVSPDVLQGSYTDKCDLWSIGVIVWMLCTGRPPFEGEGELLMRHIRKGEVDFNVSNRWDLISKEAADFVRQLLDVDAERRPTAQQAMKHPWLNSFVAKPAANLERSITGIVRSVEHYAKSSSLRRVFMQFLARDLAPEESRELQKVFFALDAECKGTVSPETLQDLLQDVVHTSEILQNLADIMGCDPSARLCGKMAADSDKQVCFLDFLAAAMESLPSIREGSLHATFERLDADKSGTVTVADLTAVLGDTFENQTAEELLAHDDPHGHGLNFNGFVRVLGLGDEVAEVTPEGSCCLPQPTPDSICLNTPKDDKKAHLSEDAGDSSWLAPTVVVDVLDWAIKMFAPAAGTGSLGTSAVALFSSQGTTTPSGQLAGASGPADALLEECSSGAGMEGSSAAPWEAGPLPLQRCQRSNTLLVQEG